MSQLPPADRIRHLLTFSNDTQKIRSRHFIPYHEFFSDNFKAPKPETVKKYVTAFEEWLEKYVSRPHKYDLDRIKDNTDIALDFIDNLNNNPNANNNTSSYDVRA